MWLLPSWVGIRDMYLKIICAEIYLSSFKGVKIITQQVQPSKILPKPVTATLPTSSNSPIMVVSSNGAIMTTKLVTTPTGKFSWASVHLFIIHSSDCFSIPVIYLTLGIQRFMRQFFKEAFLDSHTPTTLMLTFFCYSFWWSFVLFLYSTSHNFLPI